MNEFRQNEAGGFTGLRLVTLLRATRVHVRHAVINSMNETLCEPFCTLILVSRCFSGANRRSALYDMLVNLDGRALMALSLWLS